MADEIIEAGAAAAWNKYAEIHEAPEFTWMFVQSTHVREEKMEEFRAALRAALEAARQRAKQINGDDPATVLECMDIAAYEGEGRG